MRRITVPFSCVALAVGLFLAAPSASTAPSVARAAGGDGLEVYVVEAPVGQLDALDDVGVDTDHVVQEKAAGGNVRFEVVITDRQAAKLRNEGLKVTVKKVDGKKASVAAAEQLAAGFDAFRDYSSEGGIADEVRAAAAAHPKIAKLVTVGQSVNGQDILALKVTKNARKTADGSRPAVLYSGTQHAREWITTEMVRRLMHHFLDGYGSDSQLTKLVDTTELWFLPVMNPDGYDYTFSTERLWRKNLRDNDGDNVITPADGVDPNRNFSTSGAGTTRARRRTARVRPSAVPVRRRSRRPRRWNRSSTRSGSSS